MTKFIILLFPIIVFSQSGKFELNENFEIEPIVIIIDSLSASDIYAKSIDWINLTFKNPDKVIKGKKENDFLRFIGVSENFYAFNKSIIYDLEYTIRIDFKDNKYRLTVENMKMGSSGIFADFKLSDYFKKGKVRKSFKELPNSIINSLNEINLSLEKYIIGKTNKLKDDW